ncbi:Arginine pathway regulatory protein ArgR, repressor of arg regulon [Euzebya pacifica]|uniref:Arginine repressor n=1 Tax=Euzebya pacifica TaxID=1608957 RepID=A0A346XWE0_9ACTN|nr:arginine repressor [Euzebya pacifica]AXV06537.1 Arginine pathway regulatory protein ArgR, repressor of arg regulon [Euzebya pacifica]
MTDRAHRQDLIVQLVATYEIASQGELVELLSRHGVEVNQATISRDLEQLGIGKQRGADGTLAYAGTERPGLAQLMRQFVTTIEASGNLAVLKTPPGAASTVASAIDMADVAGTLATLQGDDTVLVVAREPATGHDVAATLRAIKTPTIPARQVPARAEGPDHP